MNAWGNPSANPLPKGSGNNPNQTKPDPDQTIGRAGGIAQGRISAPKQTGAIDQRRPRMREVYAKELAWAERHLPGEYGPFVALGVRRIRRQGGKPSIELVMTYLRDLGRDAASREVGNG